MRVSVKRWGELQIKKQGNGKNNFDSSRSFSIINTKNEYTLDELKTIYEIVTNLTEKYRYDELKKLLMESKECDRPKNTQK
jgi:hypothetical protein